jgi:acid stress chaperone HdeA
MNRLMTLVITGCAAAAVATGCSSGVINQGGDTKCEDFIGFDDKKQNETISKMLTDEGKNEPSNIELTATRTAVQTYCQTVGTPDTPIKQAPHL